MRNVKDINKELEALRHQLENNKGTTTEVYSRIVGYYRSVRNWNKGKREEYNFRTPFLQPRFSHDAAAALESAVHQPHEEGAPQGELFGEAGKYLYFFRQTCPNCPPVKSFLDGLDQEGTAIDVDTPEGLEAASRWGVYAAPTAVFLNPQGEELFRSSRVDELQARLTAPARESQVLQEV